jgi:hypothetical protein
VRGGDRVQPCLRAGIAATATERREVRERADRRPSCRENPEDLAMRALLITLCGFLSLSQPQPAAQPQTAGKPQPTQVMVLSTFHFAGSTDQSQGATRDILGQKCQEEIRDLVDRLEKFKPTKIFLEYPAADQAKLDERFRQYQAGKRNESKNEIDQVGLRLAQRLGHGRVFAFDHPDDMDFPSLMKAAEESGRPELIKKFQGTIGQITAWSDAVQSRTTISEELAVLNQPAYDEGSQRLYMGLLDFDQGDRRPAEALLTTWYRRNLKMHGSMRAAAEPGDRVLIIVGAAHAKHLRDFVKQDPSMAAVDPCELLPVPAPELMEGFAAIVRGER